MTLIHRSKITYKHIQDSAENQLSMEFKSPDDRQILAVTAPAKKKNGKNKKIRKIASMIRSWTTNSVTSKRFLKVVPCPISKFSESLEGNDHSVPKSIDLLHNNYTVEQDKSLYCSRTPKLIESCNLESSTDEELSPCSSNNTTATNLLIQAESPIPQDINLCNEKSLSVIASVNQKKVPHRNIKAVFKKSKRTIKQAFIQKKTKIKSTISSFSLTNIRKSVSGRNSEKKESKNTTQAEITETNISQADRTSSNCNLTVKVESLEKIDDSNSDNAKEVVNASEPVTLATYFTCSFSFEDLLDKDSSFDRLYEAFKNQSIEEQRNPTDDGNMGEYSQSPILPYQYHFSPPITKEQGDMVTPNAEKYTANEAPSVCAESSVSPQQTDTSPTNPAESLKLDGFKKYKKYTSVFSNISDYDMQWQTRFHEDQQDVDKVILTLRCISWDLYKKIQRNHENGTFQVASIFDQSRKGEDVISLYIPDEDPMTTPADIYDVMAHIFDCGNFTSEHAILAYIYIKRIISNSNQSLWDFSWKYIVIAALFNAYKVWDDYAVFNADYVGLFPDFDIDYLTKMESKFLELLNWQVTVKCFDFAQAYFHLRSLEKPAQAFKYNTLY